MKKYILIGNPVSHSISPIIHNTFFKDINENDKIYKKVLVEHLTQNTINDFLNQQIQGINITVPYKIDVIKYLYKIDEYAKIIGCVNTLKYTKNGYIGYNTDINGLEDSFYENNINIQNKKVLVIGAGGSGYTACFMALKNKAKTVTIANRTLQNAQNLKNHFLRYYPNANIDLVDLKNVHNTTNINIIINTTTLGFGQNINKSPLQEEYFLKNKIDFVFDIIYTPKQTELLKIASKHNIKNDNGFAMLIYQALKAQEIWQNKNINLDYKINFKNKIKK